LKKILTFLSMVIALLLFFPMPVLATNIDNGAKIFSVNCAGCHPQGGNIIRRGKSLKQKALHRNKVDSLEAIAQMVTNGKNVMPAYQDRLSQQEIEDVAAYVLQQAEKNWQ
jgi:cytochrome c6